MTVPFALNRAPLGKPLVLTDLDVAPQVRHALARLGLRRGARVTLVGRIAGGGRIVGVAGARIAVESSLLGAMDAEPAA
ncbi:MAG: FeoA domain-containing protein [Propioniciclava sp.]